MKLQDNWKRWGKYALVLTDATEAKQIPLSKGYSISKSIIDKKVIYELWELPKQIKLGTFNNANEAKRFQMDAFKK